MDLYIKKIGEMDCACDTLILPFTEGDADAYSDLGKPFSKIVKRVFSKEFRGKKNEVILVHAPEDLRPERFLFVGLGKSGEVSAEGIRQAGGKAAHYLRDLGMKEIALSTKVISSLGLPFADFAEGALLGLYSFSRYREDEEKKELTEMTILAEPSRKLREELEWKRVLTESVCFARDLVNTPSNDMTPSHLAKSALSLKYRRLSVRVLEKKDAEKLGMGAFLSVAKGSHEPPKFIVLEYKGGKGAPVVLVGKAITFDSGGISLKPADGMEKMKYDMAGGAAVLGVVRAAAESQMGINLIGLLPATENLPGGSASKPGDAVRSTGGKTIEIINTDAEGRLVVADAIGYARRLKPLAIVDIATLTGACSIALGNEAIAMMGNDRDLLEKMRKSGETSYERVWEMPLYEEYKEYMKSDIADIKNAGGRTGSLVTSAIFLGEFAGDVPWIHLDIAGTAWAEKDRPYAPKGATGVGVRLLLNFLKELS